MNATERRNAISQALCLRRHDTMDNLAFEFSVTRRTIVNDIAVLSLSHPVYTQSGKYNGGVYVVDGYYLRKEFLTPEQKQLIEVLSETVTPEQREILRSIISKFGRKDNSEWRISSK